jgi:hypothetical protein
MMAKDQLSDKYALSLSLSLSLSLYIYIYNFSNVFGTDSTQTGSTEIEETRVLSVFSISMVQL